MYDTKLSGNCLDEKMCANSYSCTAVVGTRCVGAEVYCSGREPRRWARARRWPREVVVRSGRAHFNFFVRIAPAPVAASALTAVVAHATSPPRMPSCWLSSAAAACRSPTTCNSALHDHPVPRSRARAFIDVAFRCNHDCSRRLRLRLRLAKEPSRCIIFCDDR